MQFRSDVKKIKALADESRLAIMLSLQSGEKCACSLIKELEINQSTLSHHMRILCDAALVNCRKDGKWMYYSISQDGVASYREMISRYAKCNCEETNSSTNCSSC